MTAGSQRAPGAQPLVLALDVGGTKLATAVVDAAVAVAGHVEVPTPPADAETIFAALQTAIARSLAQAGTPLDALRGIGVGCGGPMRYPEGIVSPLNIPGWRDFPLRDRLMAAYGLPTVVDNDAKAMALGEHWRGAGQGARYLLGMVVSTGVGGGIVVDGRLLHGAQGNAGHIGHVIVAPSGPRCACGARGCVEAVASGPSIARAAARALRRGVPSALAGMASPTAPADGAPPTGPAAGAWLTALAGGAPLAAPADGASPKAPTDRAPLPARAGGAPLTAAAVAAAARAGDPLAVALFARAGRALGQGIASAAALMDLDRVVIGGGVSQAGALLFDPLCAELARRARLTFTRDLPVLPAALGRQAGLVGAAALVFRGEGMS